MRKWHPLDWLLEWDHPHINSPTRDNLNKLYRQGWWRGVWTTVMGGLLADIVAKVIAHQWWGGR